MPEFLSKRDSRVSDQRSIANYMEWESEIAQKTNEVSAFIPTGSCSGLAFKVHRDHFIKAL